MDINKMTRKEFEALPSRERFDSDVGQFDSLVVLPTRRKHDSGYRCMDFVACKGDKPMVRLSGYSDVVHIDGIGGYGKKYYKIDRKNGLPDLIEIKGWSVDCLNKSGLLRIFVNDKVKITCGLALSSFEIYGEKKEEKEWKTNLN